MFQFSLLKTRRKHSENYANIAGSHLRLGATISKNSEAVVHRALGEDRGVLYATMKTTMRTLEAREFGNCRTVLDNVFVDSPGTLGRVHTH